MCLTNKLNKEDVPREGAAWKLMIKHKLPEGGFGYEALFFKGRRKGGRMMVPGTWYRASQATIRCSLIEKGMYYPDTYPSGFHMYRARKDAEAAVGRLYLSETITLSLVRVKYRRRMAYGNEGPDIRVIVAKEMMIVS